MTSLTIGIVSGEASGDILGAGLMRALKSRHSDIVFEGIGGPQMIDQGFNSHFPMERLSVMGFVEPFKRLPELLNIRKTIKQHFTDNPPDLFIGIDSPDFTLNIEAHLREQGILTAHYVSPSVWVWRQGRIKLIAKAVDRMLTLLPFEADFYHQHNVPVTFVGHPLADQFTEDDNALAEQQCEARQQFGFGEQDTVVGVLPGSRGGEIKQIGKPFVDTVRWCLHQRSDLKFIIPAANEKRMLQLQALIKEHGKGLPIKLVDGQSKAVMQAADTLLIASGTTALEAMLLKKPMVVAYRFHPATYYLGRWMVNLTFFALPNLLAGEKLVPEVLQRDVRPEMLGPLVLDSLAMDESTRQGLISRFKSLHQQLKQNASERAAEVLLKMINNRRG